MSDSPESIRQTAERFFNAIEAGEPETIQAIYAEDAAIWHNTDRATIRPAENLKTLRGLIQFAPKRRYTERRLTVFPGGFVQQHVLVAEQANGKVLELPACLVCAVEGGRITRLDEYFDEQPVKDWLA